MDAVAKVDSAFFSSNSAYVDSDSDEVAIFVIQTK